MDSIRRIFDLVEHINTKFKGKEDVFGFKREGEWVKYTASDYETYVNYLASALLAKGIKKGDNIATVLRNRPEWNFLDMAIMKIGAVQIPIYPTISAENYNYIFDQSRVKLVFVDDLEIYSKIESFVHQKEYIQDVVSIKPIDGVTMFDSYLDSGKKENGKFDITAIADTITENDLATIIYTSGTTGFPKGVMLSHKNFVFNFKATVYLTRNENLQKALSFLPLCHVYERMLNYMYQARGTAIYYAESIDMVGENIREVSPNVFCAVPRVLEKTYDKIMAKGRELKGIKRAIFFWAVKEGEKYDHFTNTSWYNFKISIAKKLVFSKWLDALGGDLKVVVSGGASLQAKIGRVFWAAGIQVQEGYGLTEMAPLIAVNSFEKDGVMLGTVGPVLEGVDVKIEKDGEILAKGPNVMLGYYNAPEATAEVLDEQGWFRTGDIGELINGKFLKITDRKKEIFKTSGGKYVAPQPIENRFKSSPFIENILLVGENRNFVSAIIIPEFNHLRSWCKIKHQSPQSNEKMVVDKRVIKRYQRIVDAMNKGHDQVEQVKKFVLLSDEWSVKTGYLSPTLKLKRNQLYAKYSDLIESFYE